MGASHSARFPSYCAAFEQTAHRYYYIHFEFVRRVFEAAGCSIECFIPELSDGSSRTQFYCWLDEHKLLFDLSDYEDTLACDQVDSVKAVFKFHYRKDLHGNYGNVFPFSPVSFYDWAEFRELSKEINYAARGLILCKQRPHTQNFERRRCVQELLRGKYGPDFDNALVSQPEFWRAVNSCLVSVCVPGARLDILDRGQLQYIALGACTLAPRLSIELPWGERLLPGIHYLECKPDWSDLISRIEWATGHRERCLQIGANAKSLFQRSLTAKALFSWMLECLDRRFYSNDKSAWKGN